MVRKRVLLPLLAAAELLVLVGFWCLVVSAFVVPCLEEEGGLGGSSPAPAPSPAGCEEAGDCICLRVPFAVVLAASCVVGYITGEAGTQCYTWLVDSEEDEADKKAGYVAIAGDDLEVAAGAGAGGKN